MASEEVREVLDAIERMFSFLFGEVWLALTLVIIVMQCLCLVRLHEKPCIFNRLNWFRLCSLFEGHLAFFNCDP
jgi:hypothetical protein